MSRIGRKKIKIPAGVTVEFVNGVLKIKGPKGELQRIINEKISVQIEDGAITTDIKDKLDKFERSIWGTFASHIGNMVEGVTNGFARELEINGVGYKAAMQGKNLKLEVGFSHPVVFEVPEGITAEVEKNVIKLKGVDKELLGDVAARIRAVRKPEPYKGKGIKYIDEVIRRKAGKTAAKSE